MVSSVELLVSTLGDALVMFGVGRSVSCCVILLLGVVTPLFVWRWVFVGCF